MDFLSNTINFNDFSSTYSTPYCFLSPETSKTWSYPCELTPKKEEDCSFPVEAEAAEEVQKPKHLKLLFGSNAQELIDGQLFMYNNQQQQENESNIETSIFSFYDFPPEEKSSLLTVVDRRTTHLTVAINDYDDASILDTVRQLIVNVLAYSLTSVQLFVRFSYSLSFQPCAVHCLSIFQLLDCLNCIPSLQHLTVVFDHPIFNTVYSAANNLNLSFFARLTELNFSTSDDLQSTPLLYWLAKADEHFLCSLKKVALGNPDVNYLLADFTSRYPFLGKSIIELPRAVWTSLSPFPGQSFALMPRLAHINLKAHSTASLFEMLLAAGPLVHLQSMSLVLNTASPKTGHCPLYQFDFEPSCMPRFAALKSLKLVANVHSHADLHSPLWASVFPSLEHLELVHNCVSCRFCPNRPGRLTRRAQAKMAKIVEECLFRAFKQCPKLNSIWARKDAKWAQNYVVTEVNGQKVPLKLPRQSRTSN